MSFHFCAYSWEVRHLDEGTQVTLANRDLDHETLPILVDDLQALVEESGRPNLYLDFERIGLISSTVIGKLVELDAHLRDHGGRLILVNVPTHLNGMFEAARLMDVLEIRPREKAIA